MTLTYRFNPKAKVMRGHLSNMAIFSRLIHGATMKNATRRLSILGASLVASHLLLPVVAPAQTMTPAALVGTWLSVGNLWEWPDSERVVQRFLDFRADSTWTRHGDTNGVAYDHDKGRWRLSADSLFLTFIDDSTTNFHPVPVSQKSPYVETREVTLQGQRLSYGTFDGFDKWASVYQRIDPAVPLPAWASSPLPQTLQATDLIGRWQQKDSPADTMTLKADNGYAGRTTLNSDLEADAKRLKTQIRLTWYLIPGDYLVFVSDKLKGSTWIHIARGYYKISLQGEEMVLKSVGERVVYTRVSP